jgi:hypothetical protein
LIEVVLADSASGTGCIAPGRQACRSGIFQALMQILGSVDPELDHNVLPLA